MSDTITGMAARQMLALLIKQIGDDPTRDGLRDTPDRVLRSWEELFSGYKVDTASMPLTTFAVDHSEMVVLRDIEFYSTCEHHMLPFFGRAHIGYLPSECIVGISKLARVVEVFSRRLQVQERLGDQIAAFLDARLLPEGVGVVLEAQHLCMTARGITKQNSVMVTSHLRGTFSQPVVRDEFLRLTGR